VAQNTDVTGLFLTPAYKNTDVTGLFSTPAYKNTHVQSPLLGRIFAACAIDLFDAYDVELRPMPIDAPPDGLRLWGVLEFGGEST